MVTPESEHAQGLRRVVEVDPPSSGWRDAVALLLACCDDMYLDHAIALLRSLERYSPGVHVMVHMVNPSEGSLQRLYAISDGLSRTKVHVSTERTRLPSDAWLAYYASARFIRMQELLKHPDAVPVLALDADAIAIAPITWDFSDKPEAEICLRRRDLGQDEVEDHLRVAAGAVWARPTARAIGFMEAVVHDLVGVFDKGSPGWFIDQKVLGRHVRLGTAKAAIRNIKPKYVDWQFRDDAILWMGKGDRKYLDVRYLLVRESLGVDEEQRKIAHGLASLLSRRIGGTALGVAGSLAMEVAAPNIERVAVFLPRLDLPWKRPPANKQQAPVGDQTTELRLWWRRFAMALMETLIRNGEEPYLVEIPAWEITPERVDSEGCRFAFIPHRCRLDFQGASTRHWFYMQEYFRSVFVLDPKGWSASSSVYPVQPDALPPAVLGMWDTYRDDFNAGTLGSKFGQPDPRSRQDLVDDGKLPAGPFMFFPLQIPHDNSLNYFSSIDEMEALELTLELARAEGIDLVLKGHPANPASMKPFQERFVGEGVMWSNAGVHDLLRYCDGVVTLNSGVGFEALLAAKPLVTLARAEYDCVSHAATPATLSSAWRSALSEDAAERERRYARFVDWFLGRHAVDLSRDRRADSVLDKLVRKALS